MIIFYPTRVQSSDQVETLLKKKKKTSKRNSVNYIRF